MATKPTNVTDQALKILSERHGIKDLVLANTRRGKIEGREGDIFEVTGAARSDPNRSRAAILVDSGGREIERPLRGLTFEESAFPVRPVKPGEAGAPGPARPITIAPTENKWTLNPGQTVHETILVEVPKDSGVSRADVYFLADTTASMGTILSAVQSGAGAMLSALTGAVSDIAFGVGNYKDFPDDPYAFKHQLAPTPGVAAATTEINNWTASGGSDGPEGQLYALDRLAEAPGGPIGWRSGAKRIIVWFGDAPGHDPVCQAISSLGYPITEGSVKAKLASEGITVLAISTTTSYPQGLDADPVPDSVSYGVCGSPGGTAGQATRIVGATPGGQHVTGINPGSMVSTILSLVTAAVGTIGNIKLVPSGATAPFISIAPAAGYGPLTLDHDQTLKFEATFKGPPCKDTEQHFAGTIDVVADGKVVAQKRVDITVPPCERKEVFVYSVKVVCGRQAGGDCCCVAGTRPGVYATEVNIHNFAGTAAKIVKTVVPLINAGAVVGREPAVGRPRAREAIELPPHTATMDDCCRIAELLLGGTPSGEMALTIAILEIVSPVELAVSAVYTASPLNGDGVSIDVEYIEPRRYKPGPELHLTSDPLAPVTKA
jgi:hypothetical protein